MCTDTVLSGREDNQEKVFLQKGQSIIQPTTQTFLDFL